MGSIHPIPEAAWVPLSMACIMTGLSEGHFKKLIAERWHRGTHFRTSDAGLQINIDAYERYIETGDAGQPPAAPSALPVKRPAPSPGPTQLYRHFDASGTLLYVGISLGVMHRLAQHMSGSPWTADIARVEVMRFETRAEALRAEREAIQIEKPLHNIVHSRKNSTE